MNDTKLCVPVVTLSAKENKKLSELLLKGFAKSLYLNKSTTNEIISQFKLCRI